MERFPAELGRFRIDCELGRGGMGVVYRAFDPIVERPVAIKTIRCAEGFGGHALERLRREAKAVGSLEHPNIVTLFDAGDSEGVFYLVMQLVEGETLRQRMDRQPRFRPSEVLEIFRQLLAALEYAHARGIVHRDVKPANVLITPEGTIKLADFGVARLAGPGISITGLVVGTPRYMAPEQILGSLLDSRSDIFAAGCILYEMVTGRKAFDGGTTTSVMYQVLHEVPPLNSLVVPGFPHAIEAVIAKSLAKDPAERFGSSAELRRALEACLSKDLPIEETPAAKVTPGFEIAARVYRLFAALQLRPAALAVAIFLAAVALLSPKLPFPALRNRPRAEPAAQLQVRPEAPSQPLIIAMPDPPPVLQPPPKAQVRRRISAAISMPAAVATVQRPPKSDGPPLLPATTVPRPTPSQASSASQPGSFTYWMVRGDIAFQQDHYEEALQDYGKAQLLKPADGTIRRKVAITRSLLGHSSAGIADRGGR
jgi:serine/threonine-protein kinase